MEVNIRVEQGRCHSCGHEFVILSTKVEHPKQLMVPTTARCPECGAQNAVSFSSRKQFVQLEDDRLEQISEIFYQNEKCAKCGRTLAMLSGQRADLVFKMKKVISADEGLVEEMVQSVPFCRHCKENETEEELFIVSYKYIQESQQDIPAELLRKAEKTWNE
jgi:ssDNA-binding Zn-finger/Zn-ribbon topoisomerase 1